MSNTEGEFGRFKVSAAPPESTSIGRFRLIPQGSPYLQRGRFSVSIFIISIQFSSVKFIAFSCLPGHTRGRILARRRQSTGTRN